MATTMALTQLRRHDATLYSGDAETLGLDRVAWPTEVWLEDATGRTLALELDVDATSGYGATYQAPWLPLTVMVWADF
jgi:hypothetical protein